MNILYSVPPFLTVNILLLLLEYLWNVLFTLPTTLHKHNISKLNLHYYKMLQQRETQYNSNIFEYLDPDTV